MANVPYAGTPQRGAYHGRDSYLGIRPPSTYGNSPHPGEPRIPYSDAALFAGSSRDGERGRRLEEELLLSLALYGFGGLDSHYHRKPEDEEDDFKRLARRPYDLHGHSDSLSSSYRSNDDAIMKRAKESGLEKKAKDRKNTTAPQNSGSLSRL